MKSNITSNIYIIYFKQLKEKQGAEKEFVQKRKSRFTGELLFILVRPVFKMGICNYIIRKQQVTFVWL